MPLSAQEKNDIALASTLLLGVNVGQGIDESLQRREPVISLAFGTVVADLLAGLNPIVPRISVEHPFLVSQQARVLQRRGFDPRISSDPFFGDTVISTRDQDPFLDEFVLQSAQRRLNVGRDFSPIRLAREAVIEGLASTAASRGFRSTIDPSLRGGVFRETAELPLQFIEGDFL